jgi:hypothetical protein
VSDERSGDLLAQATRALRAEADAASAAEAPTGPWQVMDGWSGIVRRMRRSARRRRLVLLGGLQIALALGGLGAWAAVSGHLPALFRAAPAEAPAVPPPKRARHVSRPVTAPPPAPPEAPAPPPPSSSPSAPSSAPALPAPRRARVAALAPPAALAPAAPPPSPDALYEQAHDAHFVRKDYAAALRAWDRYLALGPATFTPEARYNRAIALVRLGRRDEAAAALRPFAAGEYGGYRTREATELLRMLDAPP